MLPVVLSPPAVPQILLYYKRMAGETLTDILSSAKSCVETHIYITYLQPLSMTLCNMAIWTVI